MRLRLPRFALVVLISLTLAGTLHGDSPGVWALTGGTVHPVSGAPIPNGTVVIRDGLIETVGAGLPIPADATTIDVTGMHVYPGFIDAQTSLGMPAAPTRRRGSGGASSSAASEESAPEPTPDSLAVRTFRLSEDDADTKRATGVTTILTAPTAGVFHGQSVILNLGAGPTDRLVVKNPAAQEIAFSTRSSFFAFPNSLMGAIAHVRQTLLDAQQYEAAAGVYQRNPTGLRRPSESASLEALGPVLRRELPVVFVADSAGMMRRALAIAREFNLRPILSGARQAYQIVPELKDTPVLVSVKWATAPATPEDREEQPLRLIRDRQMQPTTPAALAKGAVPFALVTGPGKSSDFLPGIRKAVENGLAQEDALRAVTLSPARIFGVDRQLGSLERGKIANIVVSDKPIFTKEAKVKRVMVDGREIRLPAEDEKAGEGDSPLEGSWTLTVKTPQGDAMIDATFSVENDRVTGTFSGDRGSGEIRSGSFDGTTLEFTITVTGQQGSDTSDWSFRGTLRNGTLSGTVSTNAGTFEFTGSKSR